MNRVASDQRTGELLTLATDLAELAGDLITAMRAEAIHTPTTKSSPTDPVTAADKAAEDLILTGINSVRPNDAIVGEEGANQAGSTDVTWYIDPIDGTTNYVYGIDAYCISIAAEINGEMAVAVVKNPVSNELFVATKGRGATLNNRPIAVSSPDKLALALVATGFSYQSAIRGEQAKTVANLLPEVRDIRRFGSAALDLCSVAAGRVDAYYEIGLNKWDWAAGALIAAEAGAIVTNLDDTTKPLVASAPKIHDHLVRLISSN